MTKERNSSVELLRVFCILSILVMHTFGKYSQTATGVCLIQGSLVNAVCNMAVTCFFLISGYFSIRFSFKRLFSLLITVWFYSWLTGAVHFVCGNKLSISELIHTILPVSTNKYWFISCYCVIFILSPFLNNVLDRIDRKILLSTLFTAILVFYVLPTCFYFEITNDHGKGVINMSIVYIIGRILREYDIYKQIQDKTGKWYKITYILKLTVIICVISGFGLDIIAAKFRGGPGLCSIFVRDNSIITLVGATCLFILVQSKSFRSNAINFIANSCIAVYLFEGGVRTITDSFIDWDAISNSYYLVFIVIAYSICIFFICFVINQVRNILFKKYESIIIDGMDHITNSIVSKIQPIIKVL